MTTSVVPEILTWRQIECQGRVVNGWSRSHFIREKLKVSRQTAYIWDLILVEEIPDYLFDPGTGKLLWGAGWPWNPHQMWALMKVKKFMSRLPKPLMNELRHHIRTNKSFYSHYQFFLEFNKDETKTSSD